MNDVVWTCNNRPTAKQMRALIGEKVIFRRHSWEPETGTTGVVERVEGKNVEIEFNGSKDWFWFGASGFSFASIRPAPPENEMGISGDIASSKNRPKP